MADGIPSLSNIEDVYRVTQKYTHGIYYLLNLLVLAFIRKRINPGGGELLLGNIQIVGLLEVLPPFIEQ